MPGLLGLLGCTAPSRCWYAHKVLVSPRQLLQRLRVGTARADVLARVRARYTVVDESPTVEQRAAAQRLMAMKERAAKLFAGVNACAECAVDCVPPVGRWHGGRCCGTQTLTVFTQQEIRALKWAGVVEPPTRAARGPEAGCVFRGPRGCTLTPRERPAVCLIYACEALVTELRPQPRFAEIQQLRASLAETLDAC